MRQEHHAVRLAPSQIVLDIGRQLGLHAKRHERNGQEEGSEEVFLAGGSLGGLEGARGIAGMHRGLPAEGGVMGSGRRHGLMRTGFGVVCIGGESCRWRRSARVRGPFGVHVVHVVVGFEEERRAGASSAVEGRSTVVIHGVETEQRALTARTIAL